MIQVSTDGHPETRLRGVTVLIVIGAHLASAPRAQKEAKALRLAGADVKVVGVCLSPALAREDSELAERMGIQFSPAVNLCNSGFGSLSVRLRQRLAREIYSRLGWVSPRVFGIGAPEFLRFACLSKADITIVHSEVGLWVGRNLLQKGWKVAVDFEDWFSADLLPKDRKERPIEALEELEKFMLQNAAYCSTTSEPLANALAEFAKLPRAPVVIPNCFPVAERADALKKVADTKRAKISFHWFSQTIGPGRGLETLAAALQRLHGDWQMTLRGSLRGYRQWFENAFVESVRSRVHILDPVSNTELLARTMSHDVGLALEIPDCPNRELSATNKIFEYLRAGLAVIATRTRGQEYVMRDCPKAGELVEPGDPAALAASMQRMIDDAAYLRTCRDAALEAGEVVWSWEQFSPRLVHAIASTF